jgi:pilus assembly protein CpaB
VWSEQEIRFMKPKTLILMVVAVVCGLGASYMTSRLIAERDEAPPEAPPVEKVTVLVAKKNIEMHTALRKKPEDFFAEKQFVKDDAPKDALVPEDMPKLKNKFLRRGLRKGDHIVAEDLMDNSIGLRNLPPGMRAAGIRVSAEQIAGGFASLPGSHVDIYWTTRRGNDTDTFTKVLLEDVIVLAADANTNSEGGAMVANVVTVAVNPEDALKLTLAMETGSLRLVLRQLEDQSGSEKERVTAAELLRDHSTKNKKDEPAAVPEPVEPPPVRVAEKEPAKVVPEPVVPQVTHYKKTVTVRNGPLVEVRTYWVDENDEVVVPGQPQEQSVPAPAVKQRKQEEKVID